MLRIIYLFNIYQGRIKPSLNEPSSPGIKKQESLNQNNGDDDDDDDDIDDDIDDKNNDSFKRR